MRIHNCKIKHFTILLLLWIGLLLNGCASSINPEEAYPSEDPSGLIEESETVSDTKEDSSMRDIVTDDGKEIENNSQEANNLDEIITQEVEKDLDHNNIMDIAQVISKNDFAESFIRIHLNEDQIFEYEDPNVKIMSIDIFEYLDLDGDNVSEIFIAADTNANSRPLTDIFCLKLSGDQWIPMDIPRNHLGNNGFSFKITRGKSEFDFIISSVLSKHEIHFDATPYFIDDESSNHSLLQEFRDNNHKEGDEVGFISPWGIWEARIGTYEDRNCIIALQGIEGSYGHSLGRVNIYFAFQKDGSIEILNIEHMP